MSDSTMEVVPAIEETAAKIEALYDSLLFEEGGPDGDTLSPVANEHYLIAMGLLNQAFRTMRLAMFASRRGE